MAPVDSSRRADYFDVVGCQNRIKNGRVMPNQSWGKSGVLAYFGLKKSCFQIWTPLNNLVFKIALATKPPLTGQESHLTIKCQLITAINADVLSLEIMFSLFK